MELLHFVSSLKQLRYPEAFRIAPYKWTWHLRTITQVTVTDKELDEGLARELAEGLFRMERSAVAIGSLPPGIEREVSKIRRALERRPKQLASHEIEVLDLTGQPLAAGRTDFEPLGEPEVAEGIAHPTISFCERPAVMLRGRLIQTARGIVSVPIKREKMNNMERETISRRISVAMDHGSSNSAIAVMTPTAEARPLSDLVTTMSFHPTGPQQQETPTAKGPPVLPPSPNLYEGDFQAFYKPCLGQSNLFPFVKAGIVKTAVELGSHVMGAMLEACRATTREQVYAAVVTVPAMFEQSRADATRDAALAAGLRYVATLQEPVAAAMAYGFDANNEGSDLVHR